VIEETRVAPRPGTGDEVAVVEDISGSALDDLAARVRVRRDPDAWASPERVAALAADAFALIVRNRTVVDAALLDACPNVRIVARAGTGLDNIDVPAADEHGVAVIAPRGANARSVAEHAVALALALARRVVSSDKSCRSGEWNRVPGIELAGRTWGLLGAGATGRDCARIVSALGMHVVAYDPFVDAGDPELTRLGVKLGALTEVIASSDVISCHLPATVRTRHMIGADLLAQVKPGAMFINVGRGEVVDEAALADALEAGRLAGAGLDVREQEPPIPGRLEKMDNVVLTPHVAGITAESQERIVRVLVEEIDNLRSGGSSSFAVGRVTRVRGR
jgi:D-3-phosphoglycerate dehydrogenase / 2-oxoglutarate reductase